MPSPSPEFARRALLLSCLTTGASGFLKHRHDIEVEDVTPEDWRFLHAYPNQYVARKLSSAEKIEIDGRLDDPAWQEVPFTTTSFVDIAQQMFPDYVLPEMYSTKVKVRWDGAYLYVGAELGEPWVVHGSVHGSNANLTSDLPIGNSNVPYYDNDFEVFIDVSGTNYYYKEFEMNFNNATYDVLWRAPDGGIGSQGVPCCTNNECERWCQNSSWPPFGGTFSMYPNMKTATARVAHGWSVEIAFPLNPTNSVGGLLSGGSDWTRFDPNQGTQFWYVDFSRAEHPFFTSNVSNFAALCPEILKGSPTLLGIDQWSCYWEWVWQPVAHRYMHNPDNFGIIQFSEYAEASTCGNLAWPARYVLAQVYQAQIAYVKEQGTYAEALSMLLAPAYCSIANGCNLTDMTLLSGPYADKYNLHFRVQNQATSCVRYSPSPSWTGGPCFEAQVEMSISGREVIGSISEARYLNVTISAAKFKALEEACLPLN